MTGAVAPKPAVPNDVAPVPNVVPVAAGAVVPKRPVVGWPNGFAAPNGVAGFAAGVPIYTKSIQ